MLPVIQGHFQALLNTIDNVAKQPGIDIVKKINIGQSKTELQVIYQIGKKSYACLLFTLYIHFRMYRISMLYSYIVHVLCRIYCNGKINI